MQGTKCNITQYECGRIITEGHMCVVRRWCSKLMEPNFLTVLAELNSKSTALRLVKWRVRMVGFNMPAGVDASFVGSFSSAFSLLHSDCVAEPSLSFGALASVGLNDT